MYSDGQARALDRTLTDLIDLGLLARHARWNVIGPMVDGLHSLFDGLALLARNASDEVAERAIILGHQPDGRTLTTAGRSALPQPVAGALRDVDAVEVFTGIVEITIERLHSAIDEVEGDLITAALLTTIAGTLERYSWLLRAHAP